MIGGVGYGKKQVGSTQVERQCVVFLNQFFIDQADWSDAEIYRPDSVQDFGSNRCWLPLT